MCTYAVQRGPYTTTARAPNSSRTTHVDVDADDPRLASVPSTSVDVDRTVDLDGPRLAWVPSTSTFHRAWLRPGVVALVELAQVLDADVGVHLRGADVGVPEQRLYHA